MERRNSNSNINLNLNLDNYLNAKESNHGETSSNKPNKPSSKIETEKYNKNKIINEEIEIDNILKGSCTSNKDKEIINEYAGLAHENKRYSITNNQSEAVAEGSIS